ncbi:hypothetical protein BKA63DRAFT_87922 [Paraphoma chrysanthemicola]|nr:hypothetical protein BKA63DRAFT_87922 [Paraphoma chrysanthemicola]
MPRFLKRIFADSPFRREQSAPDDLQRTRRVLIRSSTGALEASSHGISWLDTALHPGEGAALHEGGSIAGSSTRRPILAPSLADNDKLEPMPKAVRVRRRLSKRHRQPS